MKRKVAVIISIVLAMLVAGTGIFAIATLVAKNKYWNVSYFQELKIDTDKYSSYLSEIDTELANTEKTVVECNKQALPIPAECSAFIDECNEIIIDYFNDIYSVDVSEKISKLQVMSASYPAETSENVGGSYYAEVPELADKLFLNSAILNNFIADAAGQVLSVNESSIFSAKMLRTIYIHEAIHYLGFTSDPLLDHFSEALAECLTENVMIHNSIKYENITGYNEIKHLASQIVKSDPEIVRCVLVDNTTVGEHFNKILGDGYADTFDDLVFMVQKGGGSDYDEAKFFAQFMVYEYAKATVDNARSIMKSADKSIVKCFELKWMLGVNE